MTTTPDDTAAASPDTAAPTPSGRADGRAVDQLRPVSIQRRFLDHLPGSVLVSFGRTKVIVTATVEEKVPPFRAASGGGWLTAEYAMLPGSTNTRHSRRSGGREKEIQRLIGRSLRAVTNLDRLGPRTITIDCDVLQADGGTRTASITGAYVALVDVLRDLVSQGRLDGATADSLPLTDSLAAVSVGIIDGSPMLDLAYVEDATAGVDLNVVMTGRGQFVEVQGNAEGAPFGRGELDAMLTLAEAGIRQLNTSQRDALASD